MKLIDLQSYSTEKEYRQGDAINYSSLKTMSTDPESLIREHKDLSDIPGIKIGSMVDTLLTEPEKIEELYYYKPINIPTASLFELAKAVKSSDYFEDILENTDVTAVLSIIKDLGLWKSMKNEDKIIAKFDNDLFWGYLEACLESEGKMILSPEEYSKANSCAMVLSTHKYTKDIFNIGGSNIEVIDQFKRKFTLNGVVCRVMFDKIIVDHKNKIIYPYDIKTGFDKAERFGTNALGLRYDIQAALYKESLIDIIATEDYFKDFEVRSFKFIYVSSTNPNYPLKWAVDDRQHERSLNGWETPSGYHYKGVLELLEEYQWRMMNNVFDRSKEVIDNKGDMILSIS